MMYDDARTQTLLRNGAWLAIFLFGAGLLWTAWQTTRLFLPQSGSSGDDAIVISPPRTSAPARISVARWHLFGDAEESTSSAIIPAQMPETELDLVLKGIFSSTDPNKGRVIIADAQGLEHHYQLKDTLPGGATVEAIEPTRIVLLYQGRMETLTLEEIRRQREQQSQSGTQRSAALNGAPARSVNAQSGSWRQMQEQLRTDPAAAAQSMPLPIPVMGGDGKVRGFRPNPGTPTALLSQLGLRKSDIIISVNGTSVSDPAQMMGVWQQIQQTQSASVVVERNGRQVPLNINLRQ